MTINTATRALGMMLLLWLRVCANDYCNEMRCSYVSDPVCGKSQGNFTKYINQCLLEKANCSSSTEIIQVEDHWCDIVKVIPDEATAGTRRQEPQFEEPQFEEPPGIVGQFQACNHSCPIYCVDTYEPVCSKIELPLPLNYTEEDLDDRSYEYKSMINHCHVDLFSCAMALNVTIVPLIYCIPKITSMIFMSQIAALKSLKLLGTDDAAGDSRPEGSAKKNPAAQKHAI